MLPALIPFPTPMLKIPLRTTLLMVTTLPLPTLMPSFPLLVGMAEIPLFPALRTVLGSLVGLPLLVLWPGLVFPVGLALSLGLVPVLLVLGPWSGIHGPGRRLFLGRRKAEP